MSTKATPRRIVRQALSPQALARLRAEQSRAEAIAEDRRHTLFVCAGSLIDREADGRTVGLDALLSELVTDLGTPDYRDVPALAVWTLDGDLLAIVRRGEDGRPRATRFDGDATPKAKGRRRRREADPTPSMF